MYVLEEGRLGRGAYGTVLSAIHVSTKTKVRVYNIISQTSLLSL
jgi:hypothetical protein